MTKKFVIYGGSGGIGSATAQKSSMDAVMIFTWLDEARTTGRQRS